MTSRKLFASISTLLIGILALLIVNSVAAQQDENPVVGGPAQIGVTQTVTLTLQSVEPRTLVSNNGGTLSLYGAGFTANTVARLVGYGLLPTTYLNASALTAQAPAGVPAGTYDLQVSDGAAMATLSKAVTILAPTPTPAPTAIPTEAPPPPAGQPILTVRNFSVDPIKVNAGQEFVVTIEIYNNGSRAGENTMAVFPGGSFLPVGETGHMIWSLQINATAVVSQKLRAPAEMSSGIHQVNAILSANDFAGNHYDYPVTIPVEVMGKSTGSAVTGAPKIIIEGASTTPATLAPGEPFSLTLRLANRGTRTAANIYASVAAKDMAVPAAGSDTIATGKLGIDQVITITLPLMLSSVQTGGRQNMTIALEYSDYSGGNHSDQQNIGVDINTSLTRQPQLIIGEYSTAPELLSPGDTFTLTMTVSNVGGAEAKNITLGLGGEDGAGLDPFIPLKAGNVIFIPTLAEGEMVVLERQLLIDGAASPKAYNLAIAVAYDDPKSARQKTVQRLSLIVRKRPELQANFFRPPDTLMVDISAPASLEIINIGRSGINITNITAASDQMDVQNQGMAFVGPLDPGGSAPLDLLFVPHAAGPAQLVISVEYRDDFNQVQVITQTLEMEIMEGMEGPDGPMGPDGPGEPPVEEPETFWDKVGRFIKALLGLGS